MTENLLPMTAQPVNLEKCREIFTNIYDINYWGEGSGASSVSDTRPYMEFIGNFINSNQIKSIVDVGCGDWQFSRELDWSDLYYIGFDVVPSVILRNQAEFSSENVEFRLLGAIHELPPADLVVCKDVLQHLPQTEVSTYLRLFLYNYKYALVTNDGSAADIKNGNVHPVSEDAINSEISHGEWRMIKPDRQPFNIPSAQVFQWNVSCPTMTWNKQTYLLIRPF